MKGFYLIAAAVVVLLMLSPLVLLEAQRSNRFAGKSVLYNVYGSKVNSIDPATCGDTTSAAIQGYIYEGLYTYHYLKRPVEVIPLLAESLPEISQDALTYTIHLKKEVKYARNPCFGMDRAGVCKTRTVTADDFVLAFKRVADYHVTTKLALAFIEDRIVGRQGSR